MRLSLALIACALTLVLPAAAENNVVPVEKAPYHRPVFRNDQVMLLSVYLPPGATYNPEVYHTHSLDQVSVLVEAADMRNQDGDHRADMHVAHACGRQTHQSLSGSIRPAPPTAISLAETRNRLSLASRRVA